MEKHLRADRELIFANSTLLGALTDAPAYPSKCHIKDIPGRVLSAKSEEQLVRGLSSALGGLSSSTDDIAIAVEEGGSGNCLKIRVSLDCQDSPYIIDKLLSLAHALEKVCTLRDESRLSQEQLVLREIVKIQHRHLGSQLKYWYSSDGKNDAVSTSVPQAWKEAINDLQRMPGITKGATLDFTKNANKLKNTYSRLPSSYRMSGYNEIAVELLRQFCRLWYDMNVNHALDHLISLAKRESRSLANRLKGLSEAIKGLARYATSSSDMVSALRACARSSIRQVQIRPLEGQSRAAEFRHHAPRFEDVCPSSIGDDKKSSKRKELKKTYEAVMANALKHHRTHSTIQLLVFYEQNADIITPRILGTPESACYLCQIFVAAHAKHSLLHCSGRLDQSWAVPDMPDSLATHMRLHSILKDVTKKLQRDICRSYGPVEVKPPRAVAKRTSSPVAVPAVAPKSPPAPAGAAAPLQLFYPGHLCIALHPYYGAPQAHSPPLEAAQASYVRRRPSAASTDPKDSPKATPRVTCPPSASDDEDDDRRDHSPRRHGKAVDRKSGQPAPAPYPYIMAGAPIFILPAKPERMAMEYERLSLKTR